MPKHKKFDSDEDSDAEEERSDLESEKEEVRSEDEDLLVESDSDAEPEDISFSAGRTAALTKVKDTLKQMEGERVKLKEKRRKQQEMHMLQKKQKLDALSQKRLPDNLLQSLSKGPVIKRRKDGMTEGQEVEEKERLSGEEKDDEVEEQGYVPLNSSSANFEVLSLKHDLKSLSNKTQTAAEFKQALLYGGRIHRESVKAQRAKTTKRKARFK
ncbi:nucleolar protein 7 isoform X2 [Lingula anatina]|uniref:Nucleolar protein 7 isoform X1 n=1 Tax=Lingula anatina TaxID=7574 RepID=A0A1S3KEV8_LINAN|nr:nucleolar protein 7 isoform X1 [Lingula anatina]XP_013421170.1 nucleolar protein 7 isoform X2 [Lingula anatina]|eukprot:XP_013421169.1 nucleolar protein 7 isoform X1 [Lingula anatina]